MELLLIRHALPIRKEGSDGPADPELSEQGRAQSELLAAYLAHEKLDAIYSSPLRRAIETAEPVSAQQQLPIVIEDTVAEFDRMSSDYVPVEELKAAGDPRWRDIVNGTAIHQSQMSPAEFQDHVVGGIERLIDAHRGQRIAIFCHGGVIGAYTARILDYPRPNGFFYPNYTSINRIAAASSGERSIVTLNETSHLRGSGLPIGVFQS